MIYVWILFSFEHNKRGKYDLMQANKVLPWPNLYEPN